MDNEAKGKSLLTIQRLRYKKSQPLLRRRVVRFIRVKIIRKSIRKNQLISIQIFFTYKIISTMIFYSYINE